MIIDDGEHEGLPGIVMGAPKRGYYDIFVPDTKKGKNMVHLHKSQFGLNYDDVPPKNFRNPNILFHEDETNNAICIPQSDNVTMEGFKARDWNAELLKEIVSIARYNESNCSEAAILEAFIQKSVMTDSDIARTEIWT